MNDVVAMYGGWAVLVVRVVWTGGGGSGGGAGGGQDAGVALMPPTERMDKVMIEIPVLEYSSA